MPQPPRAIRLLRRPEVSEKTGLSRSSIYKFISRGTLPAPIKLGKISVWPEDELDAVLAARIGGWSDTEVQVLVTELVNARGKRAA